MAYLFPYAGAEKGSRRLVFKAPSKPKTPPRVKKEKPAKKLKEIDTQLIAAQRVDNRPIELPCMPETLRKILLEVCEHHNVHPNDVAGPSRATKFVSARRHYVARARTETEHSFPRIGRSIRKDHTTVLHNYNQWLKEGDKTIAVWRPPARTVPPGRKPSPDTVTAREAQVVGMITSGLSFEEVAEKLDLRVKTIKEFYRNGMKKMEKANELDELSNGVCGARSEEEQRLDTGGSGLGGA